MSFSQTISGLKANNWKTLNEIKTYNLDEAKFKSKELERRGQLYMLAVNLGSDLVGKLAKKREQDQINEAYLAGIDNLAGFDEYLNSDRAKAASETLLQTQQDQNKFSEFTNNLENQGTPSNIIDEVKFSSGKAQRIYEQQKLTNLAQRFDSWKANRLLNDDTVFEAVIDGQPVKIQVNDPNLTFKQKWAANRHLTREYFNIHNINKYNEDFLKLPTERGGSGFAKSILESNQAAFKVLQNEHKILLAEEDIATSTEAFANQKTPQSFLDLFGSLYSGYDSKGKKLNYAGAWKRLNEKVLPQMIENGILTPDKIVELGLKTKINMSGKEMTLAEARPLEWTGQNADGSRGKWYNSAIEAFKKKGERIQEDNDFKLEQASEQYVADVTSGKYTSEKDLQAGLVVLHDLNSKGSNTFDFRALESKIKNMPTPEANATANALLTEWNGDTGVRLSEKIKGEDLAVQDNPILAEALRIEKEIATELEPFFKNARQQYQSQSINKDGETLWTFLNPTASERWKQVEGYAIKLKRDNPKLSVNQIWDATNIWIDKNSATIRSDYKNWDATLKGLITKHGEDSEQVKQFEEDRDKIFVKDNNGHFPNVLPEYTIKRDNKDLSKEDVTELNYGVTTKYSNPQDKFSDPNYYISEEQTIFKGDVDYNTLLDKLGYVPDSLIKIAADEGLTTAEFMAFRQTANGKKDLKPEYLDYFNAKEVSTLPRAMKARLLGNINDGHFTVEQAPATINANSDKANVASHITFGESAEKVTYSLADNFPSLGINAEGLYTNDMPDAKLFTGLVEGFLLDAIGPTAHNDFADGGQDLFMKTIKNTATPENIDDYIRYSPDAGFKAYSCTGDIACLPVVPALENTIGEANAVNRKTALEKYSEQAIEEETTPTQQPVETNPQEYYQPSNVIDASLDNPYD